MGFYIQTNRNKNVQTYTDKQTDRRTVQKYLYRLKKQTDVQKDQYSYTYTVHTYITVHKTDRQTGQIENIDKQTNKQKDRQYMSVV